MEGFSYPKLTQLQVQGANERSKQQVELAGYLGRKVQLEAKWETIFQSDDAHVRAISTDAIIQTFAKDVGREVSPFMVARLSDICYKEYKAIVADKTYRRLHNDYRVMINWMYQVLEQEEKDKKKIETEMSQKIESLKLEIAEIKRKGVQELRSSLELKKRELLVLRDLKKLELNQTQKQEIRKAKELATLQDFVDKAEWVDIEDDFHGSHNGTDWVVCS